MMFIYTEVNVIIIMNQIQTTRLRQQMKERVLNELTPIRVIYEEEMAKAPLSTASVATFPTNQEIRK